MPTVVITTVYLHTSTCQCPTLIKVMVVGNSQTTCTSLQVVTTVVSRRVLSYLQVVCQDLELHVATVATSVDAKHHGASLTERWNVTWVGNNSICTHEITTLQIKTQTFIRLWVKESQEIF